MGDPFSAMCGLILFLTLFRFTFYPKCIPNQFLSFQSLPQTDIRFGKLFVELNWVKYFEDGEWREREAWILKFTGWYLFDRR